MATPRKTAGMLNFERQLDEAFPDRRRPDGWIGDAAHRTRTSSHNPDDTPGSRPEWDGDPDTVPDVRAVDASANLGPGVSSRAVCEHLARLPRLETVVRYFIHQSLIWHARNDFRPVEHDGDPHPDHIHVTFAFTEAADDNASYDYRLEEIPVALTTEDKKWIESLFVRTAQPDDGGVTSRIGRDALDQGVPNPLRGDGEGKTPAWLLLGDIARAVKPAES